MNYRERVAHHEAAHAVLAHRLGAGVLPEGINLDAPTQMPGAFGNAAVNLLDHDSTLYPAEQQKDLLRNLAVVCAGAASDSKITGKPLSQALSDQPGDEKLARRLLDETPLIGTRDPQQRQAEQALVLDAALERAAHELADPVVWRAIEKVAQATVNAGGRLTKQQIEVVLEGIF